MGRHLRIAGITGQLVALLMFALPTRAEDQLYYSIISGGVTIRGYTGYAGPVIIPETIDGFPVRGIDYDAFQSCPLTSITIPDSVTWMGAAAFMSCTNLTTVRIGNGLRYIPMHAFDNCVSLVNVIIGTNVSSIDQAAFYRCRSLARIVIPNRRKVPRRLRIHRLQQP
jgi:hypothetical protein